MNKNTSSLFYHIFVKKQVGFYTFFYKKPTCFYAYLHKNRLNQCHDHNQPSQNDTVISEHFEVILFNVTHQEFDR